VTGRLAGRSILVTGSTGIAAAFAELATAEGAATFVVSLTDDHARSLAERIGCGWVAADLTDEAAVDGAVGAMIERLGRIDGLLSVAGGSGRRLGDGPIHELTAAGWDGTIELNLRSQALVARAVTRTMLNQAPRGGSIVLVSSVLATRPVPELFATHAYAAAKGAIIALGTTMAATYARDAIRVNVIAPGLTETAMARRAADDQTIVEFARRKQPLVDGFVAPEDVARAAIYLLGDEARAVTGQVLAVDGGWSVTSAPRTPA
jgi:NAD(P)-dependent dehydrogenase (short-subunit alcohol dehydrogenase family)